MTAVFRLKPGRPPKLRENDVEKQTLDYLRHHGWLVHRNHVGTFKAPKSNAWITMGERGMPDYVATHYKLPAFWMECKRPGRLADHHQLAKHEEIRLIWRQAVVTIDSLEDLIAFLAEHERSAALMWRDDAAPGCASGP